MVVAWVIHSVDLWELVDPTSQGQKTSHDTLIITKETMVLLVNARWSKWREIGFWQEIETSENTDGPIQRLASKAKVSPFSKHRGDTSICGTPLWTKMTLFCTSHLPMLGQIQWAVKWTERCECWFSRSYVGNLQAAMTQL